MGKKLKVIYAALFLTEGSEIGLKNWAYLYFGHAVGKVLCHHLTLSFRPSEEKLREMSPFLGNSITMNITHAAADERGQAVQIAGAGEWARLAVSNCDNKHPHITVACAKGTSPVYSNELLEGPKEKVKIPMQLIGTVGLFCSDGKVRYSLDEL